jgi:hypothetical protein
VVSTITASTLTNSEFIPWLLFAYTLPATLVILAKSVCATFT